MSTGAVADGDEDEGSEDAAAASKLRCSPAAVRGAEEEVSKTRVEVIVAALKERLRARVALQRQLDALVKVRAQ